MFINVVTENEVPGEIVQSETPLPSLSNYARVLLKEASLDSHGKILWVKLMGGTNLQVNDKNLMSSNNHREAARWEGALQELIEADLIVERGLEGEVFEVLNLGYQVADMIEL